MKACVNPECIACQKRKAHKEVESYCSICGHALAYVCKDCFTQLPDGEEKYCVRCKAKREDRADHRKKAIGAVGAGAAAVAAFVATNGKKALEIVKMIKP